MEYKIVDDFIYQTYYGIKLGVVRDGNDHVIQERQQRICAFVGYLVAQEHIFRKPITNQIEEMFISGNILGVIWKDRQYPLVWDIVTEAWQGPIGLHGPISHSILGEDDESPKAG